MTPTALVLDEESVHVTAEDPTGSLGIRPGHAPLVTALVPGIVTSRDANGAEKHVAVNGGVMLVDGHSVEIVSRRAESSRDIDHLEHTVVAGFERDGADDRANRVAFEKMRVQFMKGMLEYDKAETA